MIVIRPRNYRPSDPTAEFPCQPSTSRAGFAHLSESLQANGQQPDQQPDQQTPAFSTPEHPLPQALPPQPDQPAGSAPSIPPPPEPQPEPNQEPTPTPTDSNPQSPPPPATPQAATPQAAKPEQTPAQEVPAPPPPPPTPEAQQAIARVQQRLTAALSSRYDVLEAIAIGGMATIIKLRHRVHGGLYVAKVLHEPLARRPAILSAFRREMDCITRMAGHPGIVPVTDALFGDSLSCIILPYVDGEDLDQLLLRRGKFTRDEALMLLAQLSSLLMYAESLGIAHGDLSPGNIRLDTFGQYRVLDFGLAHSTHQPPGEQPQLPVAGTPAYNSPEQIRGQRPDRRSDLYAVGAILAEVLSGTPLFHAPTLTELAEKHRSGSYTLPPELEADPPLAALTRSLVQLDPAARMESAFELSGAISALGVETMSPTRMIQGTSLRPPSIRRRRLERLA